MRLKTTNEGLHRLRPGELADLLEDLRRDERRELLAALSPDEAADALEEMQPEDLEQLLRETDPVEAARLLAAMEPDEAVDALRDLPVAVQGEVLWHIPARTALALRELLGYSEDEAGGIMTTALVTAKSGEKVKKVTDRLSDARAHGVDLDAVAVVDSDGRLLGDVTVLEILLAMRADTDTRMSALLGDEDVVTVSPHASAARWRGSWWRPGASPWSWWTTTGARSDASWPTTSSMPSCRPRAASTFRACCHEGPGPAAAVARLSGRRWTRTDRGSRRQRRRRHRDLFVGGRAVRLSHLVPHGADHRRLRRGPGDGGPPRGAHGKGSGRPHPRGVRLRLTAFAITAFAIANLGLMVTEFGGIATSFELFNVSRYISVPIAAVAIWSLVLFGSYRYAERVFLLLTVVFIAYPIAAVLAHPDWKEVAANTVWPHFVATRSFLLLSVALIGTTITPYIQLYEAGAVVDKGVGPEEYRFQRIDAIIGAVLAAFVAMSIIVATGATIGGTGPLTSAVDGRQGARARGRRRGRDPVRAGSARRLRARPPRLCRCRRPTRWPKRSASNARSPRASARHRSSSGSSRFRSWSARPWSSCPAT